MRQKVVRLFSFFEHKQRVAGGLGGEQCGEGGRLEKELRRRAEQRCQEVLLQALQPLQMKAHQALQVQVWMSYGQNSLSKACNPNGST